MKLLHLYTAPHSEGGEARDFKGILYDLVSRVRHRASDLFPFRKYGERDPRGHSEIDRRQECPNRISVRRADPIIIEDALMIDESHMNFTVKRLEDYD